jgi:hypothetical protein
MLIKLKMKIMGWLRVTPKEAMFEKVITDAILASIKAPAKKAPAKKAPAKKAPAKKAPAKKAGGTKSKSVK